MLDPTASEKLPYRKLADGGVISFQKQYRIMSDAILLVELRGIEPLCG
ncbi:hypothetical protein HYV70_00190 [Candidatus Uhrbacteria bacterium]|nr:hypothetical protein [Candidatus Uhrbacteria bacterium]